MLRLGLSPLAVARRMSQGPLFYDTFTGADGTLLTAHTPDIDTVGGGWGVGFNASCSILNNRAVSTTPDRINQVDVGVSDYEITSIYRSSNLTTRNVYLLIRWASVSSFYYVRVNAVSSLLEIVYISPIVVLASTAITASLLTDYSVRVAVSGTTISATMTDDVGDKTISYSSATINTASTRCGLGTQSANGTLDNFMVEGL